MIVIALKIQTSFLKFKSFKIRVIQAGQMGEKKIEIVIAINKDAFEWTKK